MAIKFYVNRWIIFIFNKIMQKKGTTRNSISMFFEHEAISR